MFPRPQGHGAMAQLVARFHGMEEATGSNPVSSTARTALIRDDAQVERFLLVSNSKVLR